MNNDLWWSKVGQMRNGNVDLATLATTLSAERNSLWVLLAVATANVVLGVWRPRLTRLPD